MIRIFVKLKATATGFRIIPTFRTIDPLLMLGYEHIKLRGMNRKKLSNELDMVAFSEAIKRWRMAPAEHKNNPNENT